MMDKEIFYLISEDKIEEEIFECKHYMETCSYTLSRISIGRKFFAFSPAKGYEHAHLNFFATCAVPVVHLESSNYLNFFLCRRRICRPMNILQNG